MIYSEIYDGPPLGYRASRGRKRYIAIHNTSNSGTVRDEVSYAKHRADKTSSHYYADVVEVAQSLDTELCANHAGSTEGNSFGIAWEFTGTNGKSRAWWMANVCWAKVAAQMARDCRLYGIVPRLLTVAEMRAGKVTGFVTHDLMRLAWGGTTHDDPGPNFPMDHLLALVRAELDGGDMDTMQDALLYNASNITASLARMDDSAATKDLKTGKLSAPVKLGLVAAVKQLAVDVAELKAQRPPTAAEIAAELIKQLAPPPA